MKIKYLKISLFVIGLSLLNSCDDVNDNGPNDPIPYNSEQIKFSNLITKINFENDVVDSKGSLSGGTPTNITYVDGLKGKAYQGGNNAFIAYTSVSEKIANLKSITVSFWIKTNSHADGAQCLYAIPKSQTGAFWGNNQLLIESNTTSKLMPFKTYFQKNITTPPATIEKWIEHTNSNALFNVYDKWTHIAWTYNGIDSKYYLYVDGVNVTPDSFVDVTFGLDKKAFGFLSFANVNKFIIGGYQQHLGAPWNAPETWMKTYTGAMDEFRIYNDALTATDIFRLYTFEKDGL